MRWASRLRRITLTRAVPARRLLSSSPPPPHNPHAPSSVRGGPVSWRSLAISLGVGTGLLSFYALEKQRVREEIQAPSRAGAAVGRASVGGPFSLVAADGAGGVRAVTDESFHGKWMLLYFGFTFCPDICPDELDKISRAVEMVDKGLGGQRGERSLVPVFISVDPARDTPAKVAEYLEDFHPRFVGLTGSDEAVAAAAKAYRVYYSKDVSDGAGAGGDGGDYLVDHSIITYLMGPDGQFVEHFGKVCSAEDMALRVANHLRAGLAAGAK